jgi:TonB-dependent receptor-like protein/carboxypeptidase family protein
VPLRRAAALVALVFALAPHAGAQQGSARLSGTVIDSASLAPLRAEVSLDRPRRLTRADSLGRFVFNGLGAGEVTVRARAFGYEPLITTARLDGDGETTITIRLRVSPRALETVRTIAKAPDRERFEELPTPSMVSISGAELSRVPAIGERDILRAAALLPGVVARNDFSAGFNVRGGEADQNLVLLDGHPIYNPFHLGGLFGTFIDAAVARVDLSTGAFPAQYGGRLSSVIDVASSEEMRPGVHGTTDLGLLSTSALLGGSLGNGRVSWNVAGRRTYADKVVEALRGKDEFPYHFQDAQFHGKALLGGGVLALTAYTGADIFDFRPDDAADPVDPFDDDADGPIVFEWGNRVAGLTYTKALGTRTTFAQRAGYSGFRTLFDVPAESTSLSQSIEELRLAGALTHLRGAHTLSAGYEVARYRTSYRERLRFSTLDLEFPDPLATDGDTTMRQVASAAVLYADDVWKPNDRLIVRPGVRVERIAEADWLGVSPRISAKYFLSRNLAVSAAAGRYAQWLRAVRNEDLPLRIYDLWIASDANVPVSTSTHAVLGVERWFGDSRFVRVEGYGKRYEHLSEPTSTIDPRIRPSLLRYFQGQSYGVDLYIRQLERNGFGGWISYGYGVTTRERDGIEYFPAHDRRHNANVVVSYTPAERWSLAAHVAVASGTPYTGWAGTMNRWRYDPTSHTWFLGPISDDDNVVRGPRNGERYPLYARVDISAEHRFSIGRAAVRPYVSVVNLLNTKNVLLYMLDTDTEAARPQVTGISQFPFLPSFGLRVEF